MSYHLPRIVGTSVAADWMLTGRTVSAEEADRRGLVSEIVEPDRLADRAVELASLIAGLAPLGVQLTKRALQVNTDAASLSSALELENRNQVISHATEDAADTPQEVVSVTGRSATQRGRQMSWDFSTDPEWAQQLEWVEDFVRTECEPIDLIVKESHDLNDPVRQALIPPLQEIVKQRGLWATHLGPHLGGPGYGQVKLALLNEILGRSECAPIVFGSQAPDSGNSEILAHYGTPELKARYLEPLLDNRIVSCFSMTEPQGGADPKVFRTTAVPDGDHWIINGEKWFSSFASMASFIIVMAMTDPEAPPYQRYSMFVVPGDTPGINVLRDVGLGYQPLGGGGREGYVRYENVRVPADHMLGPRGGAFVVAQTRLGGGRIHHAMRTVGLVRRIFDMICERAVSRYTQGEVLANKQLVQEMVADSWMEIEAFRLLTLQTAWKIDQFNDYKAVRADISAVKAMMQKVLHDVSSRALQLHGSLGTTHEMPFVQYLVESFVLGLADGPTEVHKVTLARLLLKDRAPAPDLFPSEHLLRLREAAEAKFADKLAGIPRG